MHGIVRLRRAAKPGAAGIHWRALLVLSAIGGLAGEPEGPPDFTSHAPYPLRIEIGSEAQGSLRTAPRTRVTAVFRDGVVTWSNIVVRVKGRTGSFRPVDGKPSLTVDFDAVDPGQRWHGCRRIHLNNSVEDASYQHEQLAAELFRAAGLPAPRVGHALVTLNGRRLGLYVLREGITDSFLAREFPSPLGNLYEPEPGPGCDVDGPMHLSAGAERTDRSDLRALADAVREPDDERRWDRLGQQLDRDRFISYVALEILLNHRDGYTVARNNYRLYHEPQSGRFQFLPSGFDRLFGRAQLPLVPRCSGLVAKGLVSTLEGRAAIMSRLGQLWTNHLAGIDWAGRVAARMAVLQPGLARTEASALERAGHDLCERIRRRIDFVQQELAKPQGLPVAFTNRTAPLPALLWQPVDEPADGRLEKRSVAGNLQLAIMAGRQTSASWRASVPLRAGRYRLDVPIKTVGVRPLPLGRHHGASLTVDGRSSEATRWVVGDRDWSTNQVEFEVKAPGNDRAGGDPTAVELGCVLRASAGEALFDVGAARLAKLDGPGTPE